MHALSLAATVAAITTVVHGRPAELHEKRQWWTGFADSWKGAVGISSTFDYVIVGGGTAGLTLASRLSEDPSVTVAVIEAGTMYQISNPLIGSTPAGDALFVGSDPAQNNAAVDWSFITAPQAGANNRRLHYAQGKALGGSSSRNWMIYQRGSRQSYDTWVDIVGDDSYSFDNLWPYFTKSVDFTPPAGTRFENASASYNTAAFTPGAGPLQVSYPKYAQPFSTYLEGALNEMGISPVEDFNSGNLMGAQWCATTISPEDAKRESSQTSYLTAAQDRTNLKVYTLTTAKKILFNSAKKATGVNVETAGAWIPYNINARREVIVSAGAFRSPQLLMVSGVGPAATLRQFNIPVIADRRGVGQGMQDHCFFGPTWRVKVQTLTRLANDLGYVFSQFFGDYAKQLGPLTSNICDFLGWEKLPRTLLSASARDDLARFPADWPEMEYLTAPGYVGNFASLFGSQPRDGFQYGSILGGLVAPLSRGTVTIQSANTKDLPIIDPNWLTHPTDQNVAIAIFKRLRQAFSTTAMQPVLADVQEYFPGPGVQTDAQILDNIRNTVQTIWHPACTCRMGKTTDPDAVVDKDAKVIGVTGLRVVDASAFAILPPGHPQSTVYALAEKIADVIKRTQ